MTCEHPPGGNCAFNWLNERQFPSLHHTSFVAVLAPAVQQSEGCASTQRPDGHGRTPRITGELYQCCCESMQLFIYACCLNAQLSHQLSLQGMVWTVFSAVCVHLMTPSVTVEVTKPA